MTPRDELIETAAEFYTRLGHDAAAKMVNQIQARTTEPVAPELLAIALLGAVAAIGGALGILMADGVVGLRAGGLAPLHDLARDNLLHAFAEAHAARATEMTGKPN